MKKLRLIIVDDHPAFRKGIVSALEDEPDVEVVFEADDTARVLSLLEVEAPIDAILVDMRLDGDSGGACVEAVQKLSQGTKMIVLTAFQNDPESLRALRAGASAFLLKTCPVEELAATIRAVVGGEKRIPDALEQRLAQAEGGVGLSPREHEVLECLARGASNKEIAHELGVSEDTVKAHLKAVFRKLEVQDRTQAVVRAIRLGLEFE